MHPSYRLTWATLLALAGSTILLGVSYRLETAAAQDKSEKKGSRLPAAAVSEQVRIKHGDNTLAGVLHIPKTKGPHPVIIFIHGSGAADRNRGGFYEPVFERFLASGFACLSWDKPGVGGSTSATGRYAEQSYYQRAAELRRAIDFLKGRGDIDPKRIGCYGGSQAGWVMPMVASRSTDIAFMIAISCPGQTAVEQSAYLMRCQSLDKGGTEKEAETAAATVRFLCSFFPAPKPAKDFWEYLEGSNPKYVVGPHKGPELDGSLFIDPAPLLEKTSCPVLAIFGAKDRSVDPNASAKVYQNSLAKAGNRHGTVKVFADADHSLRVIEKTAAKEGESAAKKLVFAPGYLDAMSGWLKDLPAVENGNSAK
jgi:uncharacterized protein